MADVLSGVLRAFSFVLLLQGAGITLFIAIFRQRLVNCEGRLRRIGIASALLGIAAVTGQFLLEAARMGGDLAAIVDPSLQATALQSSTGAAFALRLAGLSMVAAGLRGRTGLSATASIIGAVLAVVAFTVTGHTSTHPERWLLELLLLAHVLIVTFWVGALPALYVATRCEPAAAAAQLVEAFSTIAVWLVPCIFLAGAGMAVILIPGWSVIREPYGELLLVKIVGFCLLMALAALNRWRLGPAIARIERGMVSFRRSVSAEYMLIATVLAATAIMTLFFSPE